MKILCGDGMVAISPIPMYVSHILHGFHTCLVEEIDHYPLTHGKIFHLTRFVCPLMTNPWHGIHCR